jgi:DNA-binding NarL/FixJ family response regulator
MPKILIADDNQEVLRLLSAVLSKEADWNVCGQAANGRQAVLLAHQLKPDLVILDFSMPMLDGLRATAEILKNSPAVPIILYTLHKSDQVEQEARRVGARKVVSKTDCVDSLLETIRELLAPISTTIVLPLQTAAKTLELSEQTSVTLEATPKSSDPTPQSGEGM